MQIKDIKKPVVFIALKRICNYLIKKVWSMDLFGGDVIEAEFKLAVAKSKEYESDIQILAKIDTDLNWGQKKTFTNEAHWTISKIGDFNPWYSGILEIEEFLNSIESVVEFISTGDDLTEDAEFIHYYHFLKNERNNIDDNISYVFWSIIHPDIVKVVQRKFVFNMYSEAVRSALVEIEDKIRKIVKTKTGNELSGDTLMRTALSPNNPIITLDNIDTQEGKDIQKGYMDIYAGSMVGIRNPKSHRNFEIDKVKAIHFIFLASLLMKKLDEAIK